MITMIISMINTKNLQPMTIIMKLLWRIPLKCENNDDNNELDYGNVYAYLNEHKKIGGLWVCLYWLLGPTKESIETS